MAAEVSRAYHDALMRRLSMIQDYGETVSALQQRPSSPQIRMPGLNNGGYSGAQPGGSFGSFLAAISGQESNNNYGALNRHSGAMGKYQIMPANIAGTRTGWDYEALGRDVSHSQFMKSPQIQEAIAQYKLKSYYNKWGPAGAAVAWYAGPGMAAKYLANPGRYTGSQGAYPSIAAYVNMVLGKMR